MISSELIDTGTIDIVSDALFNQNPVAIDTEFMREKTYFAKLCLVQVATIDSIFCIDTLSKVNLVKFWILYLIMSDGLLSKYAQVVFASGYQKG